MFGRTFGWLIGLVAGLAVLGIVGVLAYQAGQASVATVATSGAATAVPVYVGHYGWGFGWGFGFLGFLIPLFFILLLVGLFRAGRRGWGYGPGPRGGWYGRGYGFGPGDPSDPRDPRRDWIERMHRELHEAEGSGSKTDPGSGPSAS